MPEASAALLKVASWRVGEGVGGLELEWWLLCGEVAAFEVLGSFWVQVFVVDF